MGSHDMGRVTTEILVENAGDLWGASRNMIADEVVRKTVIPNALVGTGATLLSLPTAVIHQLGLRQVATKRVIASSGPATAAMHEAVRLTIMGRSCTMDVMEVPDGVPALVGQIPLEHLDFVIDLRPQKLIGNPAHNGEHVYEMY